MIKIENVVLPSAQQWEAVIRGMRNPKNSWDRSDSVFGDCDYISCGDCWQGDNKNGCNPVLSCGHLGPNDHGLMESLAKGGPVHAKYRRMIPVYLDITAPLYWWKEFDTYKVGTVSNSCSTMHKIHDKEFTLEDFSTDHLTDESLTALEDLIIVLEANRKMFLALEGDEAKKHWEQMIQLLPSSYNQRRTVMLNYEVLVGMYRDRKNHKLDEWKRHDAPIEHRGRNKDFASGLWGFCDWIESLPYSELITGPEEIKKTYSIILEGCDDSTIFDFELTDAEYKLLKKISDKANEISTYCCMPRLYVESKEEQ